MKEILDSPFKVQRYGWQELAIMYNPHVSAVSASKRLKAWVKEHRELYDELTRTGWNTGKRLLTPIQVSIIVQYLGTP